MLEYLHVKNLALLEECELNFSSGLNILTGETGAGKSILMGSVNMALGARTDRDMIRTGAEEAYVELGFSINEDTKKQLEDMEINCDDDSVFISRKITPTKNVFKINGEVASAKQVKELAGGLLDVHGQHEHQSLLSNIRQRDMLDAFGGDDIASLLSIVKSSADNLTKLKEELNEALALSDGREREISLLKYECEEIEKANLVVGEDIELEEAYNRMKSSEKLLNYANEALSYVSSDSMEDAGSLIQRAIQCMRKVESIDESAGGMLDSLEEAEGLIGDFSLQISKYCSKLDFSPETFSEIESRLDDINSLKARFGSTIEDILKAYDSKSQELEKLLNLDDYLNELKDKVENAQNEYLSVAKELSEARKKTADRFSASLTDELEGLSFLGVSFGVDIATDENVISPKGFDFVEYMISTNPGEPRRPMKNIASGGELSRIMLGIKTILANADNIDALIFDEIDAGISGRTAWEVSKKLNKLAKEHQVIAITHLAQIAAMADSHFEIKKSVENNKTTTYISKLDESGEIKEIARLLGSDELHEATLVNAKELKELAKKEK